MTSKLVIPLFTLAAVILGCGPSQTTCDVNTGLEFSTAGATSPDTTYHGVRLALNEDIPSFAGYWQGEKGLHVLLIQGAPLEDIEAARDWAGDGAVVETTATYTFAELYAFRTTGTQQLNFDRLSSYGIDEQENKVLVGVRVSEDIPSVKAEWVDLGLPADAILAVQMDVAQFLCGG